MSAHSPRSIADLPGPPGVPLLGNIPRLLRRTELHATLEGWCERYGPIIRVDIANKHLVIIAEAGAINAILRERPHGYRRWAEQERVSQEMGLCGLFTAEGEVWKRQRRAVLAALNTNHLHRYFHIVRTSVERLHRRLLEAAQSSRQVDVTEILTSYTVDNTAALVFGHDLNTLEHSENELHEHINRVFRMITLRVGAPVPYWRWFKLPADRALDRSLAKLRPAIAGFIEEARQRIAARPELLEAPENVLEGMLAAQQVDGRFSDEEIAGNVFTLLLAGEDTTAHTLGWTIWFLATRPDIQTLLAQEAASVLEARLFPTEHSDVGELNYAEAVLQEAIRLKTVSALQPVEPLLDTTICDTHIPAGTRLILLFRPAGLDTERAHEFDPGRWIGQSDAPKSLAFGGGQRFCPGRGLAFLELTSALAMITKNFELELDESNGAVSERLNFTMNPHPLVIRLRERAPQH
jgi:cytochrome P450